MKVYLLQSIPKVGNKHEIVDVSAGYAQNVLLRQGLVRVATPEDEAAKEKIATESSNATAQRQSELEELYRQLQTEPLVVIGKGSESGTLYQAIDAQYLLEIIEKKYQVSLAKEEIQAQPQKKAGEATFTLVTKKKPLQVQYKIEVE